MKDINLHAPAYPGYFDDLRNNSSVLKWSEEEKKELDVALAKVFGFEVPEVADQIMGQIDMELLETLRRAEEELYLELMRNATMLSKKQICEMHGIDVEQELATILQQEIAKEIKATTPPEQYAQMEQAIEQYAKEYKYDNAMKIVEK
jgi:hypothetical protein